MQPEGKITSVTEKTVLNSDTNKSFKNTHIFKNITIEQDTLFSNKHIHDDDESNQYNVIALPTESVTENIAFSEFTTTIAPTQTFSSTKHSSLNQVIDSGSQNDLFDEKVTTDDSIHNEYITNPIVFIETSDDKVNESFVEKSDFITPRPFSRIRTSPQPKSREKLPTTTLFQRLRINSFVKTTTDPNYGSETLKEQQYSQRPIVSYQPSYRGTARFKFSTTKSGEYDPKEIENQSISTQFFDDNRLRSLNIDRKRPVITLTTTEKSEVTTENKIIEAKNRFNLKENERPDRLKFELTAGGKINFGFSSIKSRETTVKPEINSNDVSRVKVITGPLNKSPVVVSNRNFKKGFVEELPTIDIKSFSKKLDLNEIPLKRSDIESFVSDEEIISGIEDTTVYNRKTKQKPNLGGFGKRLEFSEDSTTYPPFVLDEADMVNIETDVMNKITSKKSRTSLREFESDVKTNKKLNEESKYVTTEKYLTRVRASDVFNRRKNDVEDSEHSETQDLLEESTLTNIYDENDGNDILTEKNLYETTIAPIPQSIRASPHRSIRRRPAKKTDFHATRQTFTESSRIKNENIVQDTTTRKVLETDLEEGIQPTRSHVVIRKKALSPEISKPTRKIDEVIERPTVSQKTTKKRVLVIRTKSGAIKSEVDIIPSTDKPVTETSTLNENLKINDLDITRRRIKFVKIKSTSEKPNEESTYKSIVARTRVFKRPTSTTPIASLEDNQSRTSTPKTLHRFNTRRKVLKVNKKIPTNEDENKEINKDYDPDIVSERFSGVPKKQFKVLKIKTPRVIVDNPLEDDILLIKTDDQNQPLVEIENEELKKRNNMSELGVGENPIKPILKYPTRSGEGRVSVTIRKRPFTQNFRTSTFLPDLTGAIKGDTLTNQSRVTIRRKFKPKSGLISISSIDEIDKEKKNTLNERNKKIFKSNYRKFSTTTLSPQNITPQITDINTDSVITDNEENADSTEMSININDGTILQISHKPRFSLKNPFKTSTTPKPTTLHHVFAIDENEDSSKEMLGNDGNSADKVIEKLQKLIEINRIVEVYSKEEKLKLLKNKKVKTIQESELTIVRPPVLDKFGEVSRQVVIKLKKKPAFGSLENTTSYKNIMFSETVFGDLETSTISLEGLFESENRDPLKDTNIKYSRVLPQKTKDVNEEEKPIVISIANLDQVILSKVQPTFIGENEETTVIPTTEYYIDKDQTTTSIDDG